ncbi:Amidase [Niveomyces insectorum RCEF 264]|uniref:amidase n=1 Tax=Niveomyces insectorum RCEF 264 TaxID=1081102 RepID=A0A167Q8E1_9HYPO|nr:Amidase [Niveomyces insectorum RCEF 264]
MGPPFKIEDWQAACAEKRRALHASIPEHHLLPPELAERAANDDLLPSDERILQCGILTPLDVEITSIDDAALLLARLASRTYTSVQVVSAFCKRASIAQQTTNCLTEILYDRALERARWLDEYMEKEGQPFGLLHGLPVSLKDIFGIQGVHTTAGLASWIPNVSPVDSAVAASLLSAGAVLYVKTTTSQSCLMVETITNVFGTTKNPYNLALSVGGSSGGEACLVAARGSVLATGTDGGGSIRFPAAFCGLWGLKCSKGRVPGMGIQCPQDGNESVNAAIGPMARTVSSLELWLRAVLHTRPWDRDPGCLPMPWNAAEAERPAKELIMGVLWDDGVVAPTPPVMRAMKHTVDLLTKAGHTVVDLPADEMRVLHRRGTSCAIKSNVQSGGYAVMTHIDASGEPVVPRTATGSPASFLTTHEVFANHLVRADIAAQYNDLWLRFGLDAIVVPAVAHPAPPHGQYVSNSYATIYNMLDYATGSVPVGWVDLRADVALKEWYDREPYARIEAERFPYDWGDKEMQELYKGPHVYKGSPVGVQIVCRRLREEKLVGIMKEVERLMASSA